MSGFSRAVEGAWRVVGALAVLVLAQASQAATRTWSGLSPTDSNWQTAANWDALPAGGDALVFAGDQRLTNDNTFATLTSFAGLTFSAGAGSFSLNGYPLRLTGEIVNNSATPQAVNTPITNTVRQTVNCAFGDVLLGGALSGSGAGVGLTKAGPYTLLLSGANTYAGPTTNSLGVLKLGGPNALPRLTALAFQSTAVLDLNGFDTAVTNISAGGVDNVITNMADGAGTNTLTLLNQGSTVAVTIRDGASRATAVDLINGNSGNAPFTLTRLNSFTGGLTLRNSANGTRLTVNAAVTSTITLGKLSSSPFGAGPITIGLAPTDKAGIYFSANATVVNNIVCNTVLGTDRPGIRVDQTSVVLSGQVKANLAPATFSSNGNGGVSLTGQVTGPNGLALDNAYGSSITVTLNNTTANPNNYQGNTVIAGTKGYLSLGAADQIPNGVGAGHLVNNGTFRLNGRNETINGLSGTGIVDGMSGACTLFVGDADTTGFSFSGTLKNTAGTLGLTKIGSGTQALTGNSTHSGATDVSAGTLLVTTGSSCSNSVVTVGPSAGSALALQVGDVSKRWACAGLTFNSSDAALRFDFGNGPAVIPSLTQAPLLVLGNVTFAGTPAVIVESSNLAPGTYPLATWTGSLSGTAPTAPVLPPHVSGYLAVDGKTLKLVVTSNVQPLTWAAGDGAWDLDVSTNWVDALLSPTTYRETAGPAGDSVRFTDLPTGAGPFAVTLDETVKPASVTVSAGTKDYTLTGSGGLAGGGNLSKSGAAALTLDVNNAHAGGTTLHEGRLNINRPTALGASGSVFTIYGGTLDNTSAAPVTTTNHPQQWFGDFAFAGSQSLSFGAGAVVMDASREITVGGATLSVGGAIAASSFGLSKQGAGTLELTGANAHGGGTAVGAGALSVGAPNGLGTGPVELAPGTALNLTAQNAGDITYSGLSSSLSGGGTVNVSLVNNPNSSTRLLNGNYAAFTGTVNVGVGAVAGAGKIQLNGLDSPQMTINVLSNATVFVSSTVTHQAALNLFGGDTGEPYGQVRVENGTWAGPVTLAGDITTADDAFVGSQGNAGLISGEIAESGGPRGLSKGGSGTITLTGANTYSGPTWVKAGALRVPAAGSVGAGPLGSPASPEQGVVKLGNGTTAGALIYYGMGETTDRLIDLAGATGGATLEHAGTNDWLLTGGMTVSAAGNKTLTLQGASVGVGEFSGAISNSADSMVALAKAGTGTWRLTAANTFTGGVTLTGGKLVAAHAGALGEGARRVAFPSGSSVLEFATDGGELPLAITVNSGATATLSAGRQTAGEALARSLGDLILGSATLAATNGPNVTSGTPSITFGAVNLASGGAGTAVLAPAGADFSLGRVAISSGNAAKTLQLDGVSAGSAILGPVSNGINTVSLTKAGAGTWTLAGSNTYSGATSVSGGSLVLAGPEGAIWSSSGITLQANGTLTLANSPAINSADRLGDALPLTLNGGTLSFSHAGGAADYSERAGALTVSGGASAVAAAQADSGRTSVVSFASLTRTGSGTVDFSGAGLGDAAARCRILFDVPPPLTSGLIGLWATYNGTSFASYDAARGVVAADEGSAFTDITALGYSVIADNADANVRINAAGSSGGIALDSPQTRIKSLLQNTETAAVVTITNQTLQLAEVMAAAGKQALTLGTAENEGVVTPLTAGGTLLLANHSGQPLTVNAPVANNASASAVSKIGSGDVVLAGTNTYTGATVIHQGVLEFSSSAAQTLSGAISGPGTLAKSGNGTLTLAVANAHTGPTVVKQGTLRTGNGAALGSTAAGTTVLSGGTLDVNGLNLGAEPITAQGAGVGGAGAIINNGGQQINATRFVTLAGDATFGGSGRWDIRANPTATFDMGGFTLTKTNANTFHLVGVNVLNPGHVNVQQGTFSIETGTATGGSAANKVTVQGGARLMFYQLANPVAWSLELNSFATMHAENGTGAQNTWAGPITLNGPATQSCSQVMSVTGVISGTGPLVKTGGSSATLTADNTYLGGTVVSAGTLQLGNGTTANGSILGDVDLGPSANLTFANPFDQTFTGQITGTGAVAKAGNGLLVLPNAYTFTGEVQPKAGVLNVASLADYGVACSLGARALSQESGSTGVGLHLMGGTLQYTGSAPQSTDRMMRLLGSAGGVTSTIDASGSGAGTLSFTYSGKNTNFWDTAGKRTLRLTGSNTGDNLFAINIQNYGNDMTSLIKDGPGKWLVTNTHNGDATVTAQATYSGYTGGTTLGGGRLAFAQGALGSAGTVTVAASATLEWYGANTHDLSARLKLADGATATLDTGANDVTFAAPLALGEARSASLTKAGAGTLTLAATNQFRGATTVSGGTLRLGANQALLEETQVTLAGGALDLNGKRQTVAALNGTGTLVMDPSTFSPAAERLIVAGELDLTSVTLSLVNLGALDRTRDYRIASAGTLTGAFASFAPTVAASGWKPVYDPVGGTVMLHYSRSTLLILR